MLVLGDAGKAFVLNKLYFASVGTIDNGVLSFRPSCKLLCSIVFASNNVASAGF